MRLCVCVVQRIYGFNCAFQNRKPCHDYEKTHKNFSTLLSLEWLCTHVLERRTMERNKLQIMFLCYKKNSSKACLRKNSKF